MDLFIDLAQADRTLRRCPSDADRPQMSFLYAQLQAAKGMGFPQFRDVPDSRLAELRENVNRLRGTVAK